MAKKPPFHHDALPLYWLVGMVALFGVIGIIAPSLNFEGNLMGSANVRDTDDLQTVALHRLWLGGKDHAYTTDSTQVAKWEEEGYEYERVTAYIMINKKAGGRPLHQLYNAQDNNHFYTSDKKERNALLKGNQLSDVNKLGESVKPGFSVARSKWESQGVIGFIYLEEQPGTVALHRLYNPHIKDHFYSIDPDHVTNPPGKWEYVKVEGYVYAEEPSSDPSCAGLGGKVCDDDEECATATVQTPNTVDCCTGGCIPNIPSIPTCDEVGGEECLPLEYECDEDYTVTLDTEYCCLGSCGTIGIPPLPTCEELGGEICDEECDGEIIQAPDTENCCNGDCVSQESTLNRIGIRSVGGEKEFYDTVENSRFVPRGNNYVRADTVHSLFTSGAYDSVEVEADFSQMEHDGYNIIRVFWHYATIAVPGSNPPVLDDTYMANVIDFLTRAKNHNLYVSFSGGHIPPSYLAYYRPQHPIPANVGSTNRYYMSEGHIEAYAKVWRDFIRYLKLHDATLLPVIFSYDLANEPNYILVHEPFNLTSGTVTPACCGTYDLSSTSDRQAAADDSMKYWANRIAAEIKAEDPLSLTTAGTYTPAAVSRDGSLGMWPVIPAPPGWAMQVVPPRIVALEQSDLDYIDLHRYPHSSYSMAADLATAEYSLWQKEKPLVYGEFGAAKHLHPDVTNAAYAMRDFQVESCGYGFQGWMLWTWDTESFTDFWNAGSEGGAINGVLAPIIRSDPCAS